MSDTAITNQALARPTRDINHIIAYGQSLAMGYEGWPALSLRQPYDSLMLGDGVRPAAEVATEWRAIGQAVFRPLVATVQPVGGAELLRPDQVAALPAGDSACGETVLEGAVNLFRGRLLAGGGALGRRRLLASTAAVGGRPIEALSRGAVPNLFDRLRTCIALARETAGASNLTYGVTALLFLQGEHNSFGSDGGTSDRETYRDLLAALHREMLATVATASGQSEMPGFFSYQTGGAYANPTNSIAQAQLEFCLATPGCFMVGPSYPVTEKFGHLDANGYRWLGAQFGKAMDRVLRLGQNFLPLHPLRATLDGRRLQVAFHVPVPPLAWGKPFVGQSRAEPKEGGFAVWDSQGEVPLADWTLAGPDSVDLTLTRDTAGPVTLRYADQTRSGRGALHDSDADVAPDPYVYDPATGHAEGANQPDLNGKPYPLQNWCVAFAIPVTVASDPQAGPASRSGAAWAYLDAARTEVTGERLPRPSWWARLFGRRPR
jgi:hypothetical protein